MDRHILHPCKERIGRANTPEEQTDAAFKDIETELEEQMKALMPEEVRQ